jgi:hypothetical protein
VPVRSGGFPWSARSLWKNPFKPRRSKHEGFFGFFETSTGLYPYLACEKSKSQVTTLLGALGFFAPGMKTFQLSGLLVSPLILLAGSGVVAVPQTTLAARSVDEQVKSLAQRYEQVEAQLGRSVHYIRKTESDGATTVEQAWFNGAGELIKVAVDRTDSSGGELTEYFGDFFHDPLFTLTRKETRFPDGSVQIDESRKYFGAPPAGESGKLIRELRKSAHFKAGESTDTAHVPNVNVDLTKQPKDDETDKQPWERPWLDKPLKVVEELKNAGGPDFDPFENVKGDSERFRVIHLTASPDGRYAIALGFARAQINWDEFSFSAGEKAWSDDYRVQGEEGLRNYVVDLVQQRILGETGCDYFTTNPGPLPGLISCTVEWSPDSTKFVQEWEQRSYVACVAGQITAEGKLIGVADLGKEIEKGTFAFLKKHPASLVIWMENFKLGDNGSIVIDVIGKKRGDELGDALFSLTERFRLSPTPSRLHVSKIDIRKAPQD